MFSSARINITTTSLVCRSQKRPGAQVALYAGCTKTSAINKFSLVRVVHRRLNQGKDANNFCFLLALDLNRPLFEVLTWTIFPHCLRNFAASKDQILSSRVVNNPQTEESPPGFLEGSNFSPVVIRDTTWAKWTAEFCSKFSENLKSQKLEVQVLFSRSQAQSSSVIIWLWNPAKLFFSWTIIFCCRTRLFCVTKKWVQPRF